MHRFVLLALLLLCGPARATTRLALVVGNNAGAPGHDVLQGAEADAGRMAQALQRFCQVDAGDAHLVLRARPADLWREIEALRQRVRVLRQRGEDALLFFYYAGHSDGEGLELGAARVPFAEMQRRLDGIGARARVEMLDTCKSGRLSRGSGPPPMVTLFDERLESEGWATLAASDWNENAQEWARVGDTPAGLFTRHLIAAFSGEADRAVGGNNDQVITLHEVHAYVARQTLLDSARGGQGAQNPVLTTRLTGRALLVLADVRPADGVIELPGGFDELHLIEERLRGIRLEGPARVAVRAGRYTVVAARGAQRFETEVEVGAGTTRVVQRSELHQVAMRVAQRGRGGPALVLVVGGGVQGPFIPADAPVLGGLHLGLRTARPRGFLVSLDLSAGPTLWGIGATAVLLGGYRLGRGLGPLRLSAGLLGGAALAIAHYSDGQVSVKPGTNAFGALLAGPFVSMEVQISRRVSLLLEGQVPLGWSYIPHQDPNTPTGLNKFIYLPAGWAGLGVEL